MGSPAEITITLTEKEWGVIKDALTSHSLRLNQEVNEWFSDKASIKLDRLFAVQSKVEAQLGTVTVS